MKIIRANKGLKLSEASQTELCLCSGVTARRRLSSGGGWRCLQTAQGIMGERPRRSLQKEKEASVQVEKRVSESQLWPFATATSLGYMLSVR